MIQTSGPVKCSEVKGLLHLDEPWWVDTGIVGCAFRLDAYGDEVASYMDNAGRLFAAPGYLWDGTSRPVVRAQETVDVAPSLTHDLGYEGARAGKIDGNTARKFDALYIEMLRERGMGELVRPAKWYGWPGALLSAAWGKIRLHGRRAALATVGWTARLRTTGPQYPQRVAR